MQTEQQKMFNEAIKIAEMCGLSPSAVSIEDFEVTEKLYVELIHFMSVDDLLSHYKDSIETEKYEQCILIEKEFTIRNIKVIITNP